MAKSTKKKKEETTPLEAEQISTINALEPDTDLTVTPIELLEIKDVEKIVHTFDPPKPIYRKELDNTIPFEERIEAFMASRGHDGYIGLNDFLKSLYGVHPFNTPPKWANQGAMKELKGVLDKMQSEGKILIEKDSHKGLGKHYYEGTQQIQSHHDLNSVIIRAKKIILTV